MPDYDMGPIFLDTDVEQHVADTCELWMPYYLGRADEGAGLEPGTTLIPRSYDVSNDEARWPEQTPPALLVVCPGTIGDLTLSGAVGALNGWLQVNISVSAGGADEAGTRALAHRYCAALREILMHQVRGELVDRIEMLGWRHDLIVRRRKLAASGVRAALRVPRILQTLGDFPDQPPGPGVPGFVPPTGARIVVDRQPAETPERP